jgi:L-ascorbate metabolism protein UlaG (beta-lactamase superfamily)
MKLKWMGHSCFLVTASDRTKILFDPYEPGGYGGALGYGPVTDEVDVVVMSHDHADHGWSKLPGEFTGLATFHDRRQGAERGPNTVFTVTVDGVKIAHLGDLGHIPDQKTYAALKGVDVLLIPVGGHFTIDHREATQIADAIKPKVVVPMHYKTPAVNFPIVGVEEFTKGKTNVKQLGVSEVQLTPDHLPAQSEVWVFKHAL